MFIKLTRVKNHSYAQLVESFRDANGQPRQRNLATLGRVDENGGPVDKLLASLLKARGHSPRPGVRHFPPLSACFPEFGSIQINDLAAFWFNSV